MLMSAHVVLSHISISHYDNVSGVAMGIPTNKIICQAAPQKKSELLWGNIGHAPPLPAMQ